MALLKETWLFRLYQADKKLFAVVAIYLSGLLWFSLKQHEEFPFLLYGMYSLKEEAKPTYTHYVLKVDGQEVKYAAIWDLEKEVITSPLLHTVAEYDNGKLSKEYMQKTYAWLLTYMADMRLIEENTLEVERVTCSYRKDGSLEILNRETLARYAAN